MNQQSKLTKNWTFDLIDCLRGPILTNNMSWTDTIPKWLLEAVSISRLAAQIAKEETATYVEVVIYLYTASLVAPLSNEWTDIYTHCTCLVMEQQNRGSKWDNVKAPRELDSWKQHLVDDLRGFIYNKRREILKKRLKSEKREMLDCSKITESSELQLSLFA